MPVSPRPRVAVLTPTYNHEAYIAACIESVLRQTRSDWEMVVIDDGSTDRTADIVASYSDPRITLLRAEHRGLNGIGDAYRDGLDASSAPLIAILEGDDEWPSDKLALQVPAFDDARVVLAYGAAAQIDEHGCEYAVYSRRPPGTAACNDPPGSILPDLIRQNFIVAPTVVVRRSALTRVGGFWQPEGIPYIDHPTWLRLALVGRFAYESRVVGRWRRHSAQFTTVGAAGRQPDNRAFLLSILDEAVTLDVPAVDEMRVVAETGPQRHSRWASISAFRLALLDGSVRDAVRASADLFATRRPKWIVLALGGLLLRLAGSDLEWVFRATHRFSWPSRRHRRSPPSRAQ